MPEIACSGAEMQCTFGTGPPSTLTATSSPLVSVGGEPAASTMDFEPLDNIAPFGLCTSLANPAVAAATAAALGVLTPVPCVPNVVSPWSPGSPLATLDGNPALDDSCTCNCLWGGDISITFAGQEVVSDS